MIRFDVPFLAEDRYVAFLAERAAQLHSLHFRLAGSEVLDARHPWGEEDEARLLAGLRTVAGPRKYALLNSRFLRPECYLDGRFVAAVAARLARLLDAGQLDGVVFADYYLLRALADAAPALCEALEAVPSVNSLLDSVAAIAAWRDYIAAVGFRPPGKIVLDRHMNRSPVELAALAAQCRRRYPELQLALLANEGCLFRCPCKLPHDAQIALANTGLAPERCGAINDALGCRRFLAEYPEQLFRSPFIRPEDVARFAGRVDVIKLCGRTLGPRFLERVVAAYLEGSFAGNLLALTDAMAWLAVHLHVANDRLPVDFFARLTGCAGECRQCGYCRRLYEEYCRPTVLQLKDWRGQGTLTF